MAPAGSPRRTRPLVNAVAVLVLATLVTVIWITTREIQVQRSVYTSILENKLETTRREFRLFLRPLGRILDTMTVWHGSGLLPVGDPEALRDLVTPTAHATAQVAVICVVPDAGPATILQRDGDSWSVTEDTTGTCRRSAWYARARADSAGQQWSDYEPLPGGGREGLMTARRSGDVVVAAGLAEADLDAATAAMPITENGILVRLFDTGHIAWLTPRFGNRLAVTDAASLLTSDQAEHGVIGTALMEWGRAGRTYRQTFTFRREGETWWAVFYPEVEGTDPGELSLLVPAGDLSHRLETALDRVTILLAAGVGLAMIAVIVVAFDYRRRLRKVARRVVTVPADEDALAALIAGGESEYVEFKSTMRWNLHADKPGKEIELAWLKSVVAYLNTDGGVVLLGVKDDGEVLGLDADKFRNDDKVLLHFENLIHQHVGLEFAASIKGELRTVGAGRVFLVACGRSDEPVFLRDGESEDFYVRVGPSSRRLPASRILDYTRERQS